MEAISMAINSPLLEETSIEGAKAVLINIAGGNDLSLHEVNEVTEIVQNQVDPDANIIFGTTVDAALDDRIRVTVIATGFDKKKNMLTKQRPVSRELDHKTGTPLTVIEGNSENQRPSAVPDRNKFSLSFERDTRRRTDFSNEDLDIPTFLRRGAE